MALTLLCGSAQAQDSTQTLNPVVVTATKFPIKQVETGKVLTIITREELQRSLGKNIGEVLNEQVGITVSGANNTRGTNLTVYTRGASSANTLILIDGVPAYDPSGISSEFDLNTFSISQIERIEIMKGAQSTLYGSDAVAGVINIITKKNSTKPINLSVDLSAGSYDTYKESIALSGGLPNGFNYFVGYSKTDSKGISAAYDSTGIKNFEKDGFHQDAFQANVGYKSNNNFEIRAYTKLSKNKSDIDAGAFKDDKDYTAAVKNTLLGTQAIYHFNRHAIQFNYNYNYYNREYIDDSASVGGFAKYQHGNYSGKSHFAELNGNFRLNKILNLVTGIDYRTNASDQSYKSLSIYGAYNSRPLSADTIKTNQFGAFASLLLNVDHFSAEFGSRYNKHSIYGDNFTYSFGPSYIIDNQIKLFANISSGYRVPSLYQLYAEYGNKGLKPERSASFEEGVEYFKEKFSARLVAWQRNIRDVISFYTDPSYNSKYINEDRQNDNGIETELSATVAKGLQVTANYAYTNGQIHSLNPGMDTTFYNLYRRPKNTFNLTLGYHIGSKAFTSVHLRTVDKYFEPVYAAAPIEIKGYYTLNVYGEYRICKALKLFADFRNITDQKYFDIRGFNSKMFNCDGGVSLNF